MGAVCPSCGLALVPGAVRCPKCQTFLPVRRAVEGGTAVAGWHIPRVPAIAAGVLVVLGVVIALAHHGSHAPAPTAVGSAAAPPVAPSAPTTTAAAAEAAVAAASPAAPVATSNRPDPGVLANQLESELQRQELWSTVEVVGDHVEVRSSSCNDPKLASALTQATSGFKAAGLTQLRCVEQSGVLVFTRAL